MLLSGLVVTTPVLCVCDPAEHGGMAVHSLLPHSHVSAGEQSHDHQHDHGDDVSMLAGHDDYEVRMPVVTAQYGGAVAALGLGGAVHLTVTPPFRLLSLPSGWLRVLPDLAPDEHRRAPLGPPPR